MSVSKLFVQLPVSLFFILATLVGTHVWSNDRINTYKLTPIVGESSTLSIRERSKDGAHLLLSEFRSDAGRQEAGQQGADQQEVASAVIDRRRGVMRLIPNVIRSGIFNSHREIYHPPSSEVSSQDWCTRICERHFSLPGVTIPSVSVLSELSSSPDQGEDIIVLVLPLPSRIPVQLTRRQEMLCLLSGNIREPVVKARDDSTFIVSGNSVVVCIPSPDQLLSARQEQVEAVFTQSSADGSVQLSEFRVPGFMTITHTDSREAGEHDEDMESFWLQLERYQERTAEYINGLGEREQEILRAEISRRNGRSHISPHAQARRLYDEYLTFMASIDNEDIAPVSSTPEIDNADMELEPGTAGNDSLSNEPENQPVEPLVNDQPPLSLGLQSNSK